MSAPPSVPPELKPITPYLARAHELATADPVIAYWCTYFALQQAMTLGAKDSESQTFLFALMDRLEAMKGANADNDAVTEDAAASAYIENFGFKIFSTADNEDRKGKATRATARKFLAAANFLELLTVFGEVGTENREKIKYSKWKATDIAKAFREGRTPVPGPAGGLPEVEDPAVEVNHVTAAEEKELSKELAALGSTETKEEPPRSPALSSPPAPEADDDFPPSSYPFPQQPTTLPFAPSASSSPTPPDFVDEDDPSRINTPSLPTFIDTPSATEEPTSSSSIDHQSFVIDSNTHLPPSHQTATLPTPSFHLPSEPPAFPSVVFPPPAPVPRPSAHPAPVSAPRDPTDPLEVQKIQKHAKWAISALNYEDFETARKELRLALEILGG
ncbi:hypothetical protein JCM5353_002575 [Sporobolomyces roseus]